MRFRRAKGTFMVKFWVMLLLRRKVKERNEGEATIAWYCGSVVFHM